MILISRMVSTSLTFHSQGTQKGLPIDAFKSMKWSCEENGFKWEEHTVTTDDGYILPLWRIPGTKKSEFVGAPVLL